MNRYAEGNTITLTAAAAVAVGAVIALTHRVAVAITAASTGQNFTAFLEGVTDLTAAETHATDQAWVAGVTPIYWDASAQRFTATAAGNVPAGFAFEDKASTAAVGRVRLRP